MIKLLLCFPLFLFAEPKFLHVSYHKTCLRELEYVGKELGISIESLDLFFTPPESFDGVTPSHDFARHVMTREKANAVWKQNQTYFESFDGYIVSDPVSLFRVFLQNAPEKPLIVWVCNRFDSPSPAFPDKLYYQDFQANLNKPNVRVIAYTPYEIVHAKSKQIRNFSTLIRPIGIGEMSIQHPDYKPLPLHIDKTNLFFVRKYLNETSMNLPRILHRYDIPHYIGPYLGPQDLNGFKGVIHIPAVISNFFLFENLSLGLVQFIPSKEFFKKLAHMPGFVFRIWSKPKLASIYNDALTYSEWYSEEFAHLFVYFDSWEDLKEKIQHTNFPLLSAQAKTFAETHRKATLEKWRVVFLSFSL